MDLEAPAVYASPRLLLRRWLELMLILALLGTIPLFLLLPPGGVWVPIAWCTLCAASIIVARRSPRAGSGLLLLGAFCATLGLALWGDVSVLAAPGVALGVLGFLPLLIIGGLWGGAPTVLALSVFCMACSFQPGVAERVTGVYLAFMAGGLGVAFRRSVSRSEAAHRVLASVALTEPVTGLGNLRCLRRDLRHQRAFAGREGHPLLLIRWSLDPSEMRRARTPEQLIAFARILEASLRRTDTLYYLGDWEFVGLHPQLESASSLARRIRSAYPELRLSWTLVDGVDGSTVEQLLDVVRARSEKLENVARAASEAIN